MVTETSVLYDPGQTPYKGMRSAVAKAFLSEGEVALSQNLRWDSFIPTARGGTVAVYTLPASLLGATIVDLQGFELNGVQTLVVAYLLNSKYEIWASEAGGALFRVSEVGGFFGGTTGDTRFTTLTGRVLFQPVPTPRYSVAGAAIPSRDALIVSNGTDPNYVWTPTGTQTTTAITNATNASPIRISATAHGLNSGDTATQSAVGGNTAANGSFWVSRVNANTYDLYSDEALTVPVAGNGAYTSGGVLQNNQRYALMKNLIVPVDWKTYGHTATMRDFWTVAAATGTHTFASAAGPPAINQAAWSFGETTTAPYNAGTNICLLLTMTTSAATGNVATFYMSGDQLNMNRQIVFLVEGTVAAIDRAFSRSKIDIGKEDVVYASVTNWSTIYDPSGTAEKQRKYDLITVDATNNRYLVVFPVDHIAAANRTGYHLRFTYDGAAPTTNTTLTFLAIMGSGDFAGGSTLYLSVEDRYSYTESFRMKPTFTGTAKFEDLGGPDSYTGGQREQLLPNDTDVLYDYKLTVPNSQGADAIEGGLNGEPSHYNVYLQLAEEDTARYLYCDTYYAPGTFAAPFVGRGWAKTNTGLLSFVANTSGFSGSYGADESDRDPFREAPSDWNTFAVPPFLASCYANSRLFFGNVYDATNTKRKAGSLFFSWKSNPFRVQDIPEPISPGVYDERSGNHDEYAGESILAIASCAAQASGRSMVHVVTSRSFNVQGYAGGFTGSADESSVLGAHTRISNNGTQAPRAVSEADGRIIWPDQFGQHMEYYQGQLRNVSRFAVDDKYKNIPTGRTMASCAVIFRDRYYNPYTIAAGSTNARILGRNFVLDAWEFDDLPPVSAERIAVIHESTLNGSGQRLLIAASTGIIYEYDKTGQNDLGSDISIRLTFAEHLRINPGAKSLRLGGVWIAADAQVQTWTLDRYYRHQTGLSRSTISLSTGRAWDQGRPAVISGFADGRGERGMGAYLDVYGTMTTGTSLYHIGVHVDETGMEDEAPVGN